MAASDEPISAKTLAGITLVDDELASRAAREVFGTSARGHVLVVEPEPGQPAAKLLEAAGFSVQVTADGVVGSQYLATMKFDAVVSDVHVGGLGGIDLLRYAREHDQDIPVLLMTGAPDVESAAQAVEHGAFQYLLKPLPPGRLVEAVEKAVRTCTAARARSRALEAMLDDPTQDTQARLDRSRWDNALATLWMAYQPIVLPSGKLYAYEALVRSEEPTMRGAGDLLDMAESLQGLVALGRRVREQVGRHAADIAGKHYVFVNLHADDLLDEMLTSREQPLAEVAPAVVLEITERAALHDVEEAKVKMAELRSMGFRIALDDLGAGYAGLTSFAHLLPEIVKLDMALVRGIDKDPVKRKLVKSVAEVSRDIGTLVVGEGVETAAERDVLMELGCNLLQGYLFGKPARL